MMKLFSRRIETYDEEEDTSSAEEEEEDIENDKPYDVFPNALCFQNWGHNIRASYHFLSVRHIAPHLSTWCFNRKMDVDHKKKIKDALMSVDLPHLMGSIQVVRDKKLNCRVINGQHRLAAIQEIIKEDIDMKFKMNVMFEVYDCDIEDLDDVGDVNTHVSIENIFKIANNNLNMKPEQDHDLFCKQIVIAMMADPVLKKGIVDKTNGNVHKPKITAKHLFENLKAHMMFDKIKSTVPELIVKIKKINAEVSSMPFIKLFGRHNPAQFKQKQFEKAKALGFYLNLESNMKPCDWIEMLT